MRLFSPGGNDSLDANDARTFAKMRIVLALAALLVTLIDRNPSERPILLIYAVLLLFNPSAIYGNYAAGMGAGSIIPTERSDP